MANTGTGGRRRADFVLPDDVIEFLKTSLDGNFGAKPKDLTATLIEEFEDLYPEIMNSDNASKIRTKIGSVKSKMKSDAKKSIL